MTKKMTIETKKKETEDLLKLLDKIAYEKLGILDLFELKNDGLDFHECSVWRLRRALLAAYDAGLLVAYDTLVGCKNRFNPK